MPRKQAGIKSCLAEEVRAQDATKKRIRRLESELRLMRKSRDSVLTENAAMVERQKALEERLAASEATAKQYKIMSNTTKQLADAAQAESETMCKKHAALLDLLNVTKKKSDGMLALAKDEVIAYKDSIERVTRGLQERQKETKILRDTVKALLQKVDINVQMEQVQRVARVEHDGHYTIMRFTTDYKGGWGTPTGDMWEILRQSKSHPTLELLLEDMLTNPTEEMRYVE